MGLPHRAVYGARIGEVTSRADRHPTGSKASSSRCSQSCYGFSSSAPSPRPRPELRPRPFPRLWAASTRQTGWMVAVEAAALKACSTDDDDDDGGGGGGGDDDEYDDDDLWSSPGAPQRHTTHATPTAPQHTHRGGGLIVGGWPDAVSMGGPATLDRINIPPRAERSRPKRVAVRRPLGRARGSSRAATIATTLREGATRPRVD